jgi:hypothetical protein
MVVLADSTAFALSEIGGRYESEYIEDQPVKIQFLQGGCAVCRLQSRCQSRAALFRVASKRDTNPSKSH